MEKLAYWVSFSKVPSIGKVRLAQLEEHFDDRESVWGTSKEELKQARLDSRTVDAIRATRSRASPEAEMERLEKYQVQALTYHDPAYPARLKEIYDFPPLVYVRGKLTLQDECCPAVVGTRRANMYGKQVATYVTTGMSHSVVRQLGGMNYVLVKE